LPQVIDFHYFFSPALPLDGGVQVVSFSEAEIEPSLNVIPTLKPHQNRLHLQPNSEALFDSSGDLFGKAGFAALGFALGKCRCE
jgi:hypothetical protein